MTTRHSINVVCECGHEGVLNWSENDQPFSRQWESYSISGFEGEGFYIEGFVTDTEALKRINPKCPECGAAGKVTHAKRT